MTRADIWIKFAAAALTGQVTRLSTPNTVLAARQADEMMEQFALRFDFSQDFKVPAPTVTRFEVVDDRGRVYTKWDCSIQLAYQDGGRTLKVFVEKP